MYRFAVEFYKAYICFFAEAILFCCISSGVLRVFFDTLYDEDIISEDAFNQWEGSTDSSEQAGKGVALASVVQFFTWLREADDEEEQ